MNKLILLLTILFTFTFAHKNQEKPIEIYFTKTDNVSQKLLEYLDSSKISIYAALYDINSQKFVDKIIEKKIQGIDIKIVTDSDNKDKESIQQLIKANIPLVFDEKTSLMHHKFLVIDHKIVWTGSTNITDSCLFKNRNNAIVFSSNEISEQFEAEFLRLFEQKDFSHKRKGLKEEYYSKIGKAHVNYYFSPKNGIDRILVKKLEKAKNSIFIAAFSFSHPKLITLLKEKIEKGLKVEVLLDRRMSKQQSSICQFLDEKNIFIYNGKGKLHHKIIIIDQEIVITGSFNFSKNATDKNNENLVIVNDPEIAEIYLKEYQRLKK